MPTLRNVSPFGDLDIDGVGTVEAGATFDVSAEIAGKAPSGTPGEEDFDPGSGLLAQPLNFAPADKAPSRKPKDEE